MSTSLLYHAFGLIGYFCQSTSYIAGAVIVAIRDDYWRLRCPQFVKAEKYAVEGCKYGAFERYR